MVEVLLASFILLVGFIGLMEAVTVSANTMDHARRQTLATQILSHEIKKLYLAPWTNGSTGINDLTTAKISLPVDSQFDQARIAVGDDLSSTALVRFSLARTVTSPDPIPGLLREVNFTVTWIVGTSRRKTDGTLLSFTFTRTNSAWYGKNGLHLSHRSS
jgi:hypothetical protein